MRQQSQKNPIWSKEKLGTCDTTFGESGCYITSLANLVDKTPLEVNKILLEGGGYTNGCLVNSQRAAELLGMNYLKADTENEMGYQVLLYHQPIIAETNYYAPKTLQHFFILLPDNNIIDPLNPVIKRNFYPIKSLRIFKKLPESGETGSDKDMTNNQFLHALYFGFYNRTPDPEGLQFWLNRMEKENVSAGEVVRGLLSSDEAQKHFKYII